MADVFISYKRERRLRRGTFEQILIRYGYTVWFDLALVRGKDYEAQIERELTAAKAVIVLWCGAVCRVGRRALGGKPRQVRGQAHPAGDRACTLPLFSTLEQNIDLTARQQVPARPALDPVLDDLERLIGRPPQADLKALRDYVATWRSMGRLAAGAVSAGAAYRGGGGVGGGAAGACRSRPSQCTTMRSGSASGRSRGRAPIWSRCGRSPRRHPATSPIRPVPASLRSRRRSAGGGWSASGGARRPRTARSREGRIKVDAKIIHGAPDGWFKPGAGKTEWFKDIDIGPEMVVVPAGEFTMGSNDHDSEKPPHKVTIKAPFAVGRFAVTFAEWDAAGLSHKPGDQGWGRGRRPVINVSWEDAKAYASWLSQKTGKAYRLLCEAEWEYCCRAGTTTKYAFGDSITHQQAQFSEGKLGAPSRPSRSGSSRRTPGGSTTCTATCGNGARTTGTTTTRVRRKTDQCGQGGDASLRVLRGGPWIDRTQASSARPSATSIRTTATTSSASELPERCDVRCQVPTHDLGAPVRGAGLGSHRGRPASSVCGRKAAS